VRKFLDKIKFKLFKALLPKEKSLRIDLAKHLLGNDIYLGWADITMAGRRIKRLGKPVLDDDAVRKGDVAEIAMPIGELGDMIYHDGTKWTALKAPATEKMLKHPGGAVPPEWADFVKTFLNLADTPTSYPAPRLHLRINDAGDAVEFKRQTELFTAKPTAEEAREGELIRVRAGAGAKTYLYICVQNSADTWEWVQVALST